MCFFSLLIFSLLLIKTFCIIGWDWDEFVDIGVGMDKSIPQIHNEVGLGISTPFHPFPASIPIML